MPKVEVDQAEWDAMQKGIALLQQLGSNPKTKPLFEKAAKVLNPELVTEEDVAERYAAPVRQEVKTLADRFDAFLTAQETSQREAADRQAAADLDASIGRLRSAGYTDDGLAKIKGLMVDRNIADPEAAAALFDRLHPAPAVETSAFEPAGWNIRENAVGPDTKLLFENEDAYADQMAAQVLNEFSRS